MNRFELSKSWIKKNIVQGGIVHSSYVRKPYPEVTGYFIPTLLNWGEKDIAHKFGEWLCSIQTKSGAWQDTDLKTNYSFDTGQVLKGLGRLAEEDKSFENAFDKGSKWLFDQIRSDGRMTTPSTGLFSSLTNEDIHIYALEPLKRTLFK